MNCLAQKVLFVLGFLFLGVNITAQCINDCVWPGDANNNGIANNVDFIFTGLVEATGGPARAANEQGTDWSPKNAADWPGNFTSLTGVNHKHADADGNGWIDGSDLYVTDFNYDSTNANFTGLMGSLIPGEDLFLVFSDSLVEGGDTITIEVHLGSATNVISDLHGIAFSLNLDTSKIKEELTTIDFYGGWMGTPFVDLFTLSKYDPIINPVKADFAASRGSFGPVSGFGDILELMVITEDDLAGKRSIFNAIEFNFENVLGIDEQGFDKAITVQNDSVEIDNGLNSVLGSQTLIPSLKVFPNPSQNNFFLDLDHPEDGRKLSIYNSIGKLVKHEKLDKQITEINTNSWERGIYFLKVEDEFGNLIGMERISIIN